MRAIYWFRNDLRIIDNLPLNKAIEKSNEILFVYIHDISNEKNCPWGFKKMGQHRRVLEVAEKLKLQLGEYNHSLNVYIDDSVSILNKLVKKYKIDTIYCESIKAFDENKQIELLNEMKISVYPFWQSSLFMQDQLPFIIKKLPNIFTNFRKAIELQDIKPNEPITFSKNIFNIGPIIDNQSVFLDVSSIDYSKSSFPITHKDFLGGEKLGISYLKKYFESEKPANL